MKAPPPLIMEALRSIEKINLAQQAKLIPTELLHRRQQMRETFHRMLHDPEVTAEEVDKFVRENKDCCFSPDGISLGIGTDNISRIRNFCKTVNIHFPRTEFADIVYFLVQAFESLSQNSNEAIWKAHFVVATDGEYHPHAHIRKLGDNCYSIVFGIYLLADLAKVAFTFYAILTEFRSSQCAPEGFSEAVGSPGFIKTFNGSLHRRQFPYVLVSLALGERYRYITKFESALFSQQEARFSVFYQLTICFLVAHEVAHLINGDLDGKEPYFSEWMASMFDHASDMCMLKYISRSELASFWKKYGRMHSREAGADFEAFRITQDIAVDRMGHRAVGVAAASLVLSVIAWVDRARYFIEHRADPARVVGRHLYNRNLGHVDVKLPIASHPWGKTRAALLGYYGLINAMALEKLMTSFESDRQVGISVMRMFSETVAEALAILVSLSQMPGEFAAMEFDGKVVTTYWPDILSSPERKTVFETDIQSLYGAADFAEFDHDRD
jgi:hypothetical protein